MGRQTKYHIFVLIWLGQPVGEEKKGKKKRKKRKMRKKRKKKEKNKKVCFCLGSCVLWILGFGMEISDSLC